MKIVRAEVAEFELALRRPLQTARGTITTRRGFVLRLSSEDGFQGLGEASPAYWLGGEKIEETRASLDRLLARAAKRPISSELRRLSSLSRSVICALDSALLDLEARARGVSLAALFRGEENEPLAVCALLAESDLDSLAGEAERTAKRGYGCVKLKVGGGPIAGDAERVRAIRERVGDSVSIRLDANRAWTFSEAAEALAAFAPFDIELVEEPLRSADPRELARLRRESRVRIAVDESVVSIEDLSRIVRSNAADAVVIKLARLGGPTPSLNVAHAALAAGLAVVVTDSIETSVGAAVATHLAAALPPPLRLPIGLGGAALLTTDLLGGERVPTPMVRPRGPGLGIDPALFGKELSWRG